jgi:hypothetical protein
MFDNNLNFKNLGKDIWVYNNFLSKKEVDAILNRINSSNENLWQGSYPRNQSTVNLKEAEIISSRIQKLLSNELYIYKHASITRLTVGQGHGIHSDNHDFLKVRELSKSLKDNECFKMTDNNVYGLVVYINDDYEGGEIFYTKQGIVYKPKSGDLVVHSAEDHCEHGVHPVKTNIRYSFPSCIREKIKIPC